MSSRQNKLGIEPAPETPRWRSFLLLFGMWTLVGLVFAFLYYASGLSERTPGSLLAAMRMNLARFYLWAALSPLLLRLTYRYPVEFKPFKLRNLLLHVPVVIFASGVHTAIHLLSGWFLEPSMRVRFSTLGGAFRSFFLTGVYVNISLASLIVIFAHALLYYRNYRAVEVQRSHLREQLAQAQLQALKMQLHPHFLFNTLHSISSLVLEDPPKANRMIAQLGDFLRMTLEHSGEQTVALKEEIDFLRRYLEIEQVRFDRLAVDFNIESDVHDAEVPHLILQPIVENAIRHAVAPRAAPGHIWISGERLNGLLRLEVRDNGEGIKEDDSQAKNRGLGLNNVRARLEQMYGQLFTFKMENNADGGLTVRLELPFNSVSPRVTGTGSE